MKLHHIGIASNNIKKDITFFVSLGYSTKGPLREDDIASIRVQFMEADDQPDIELVENLEKGEGPMTAHLQAKRKIFHYAYETDNIEKKAQELIDSQGGFYLVPIQYSDNALSGIYAWCYLTFRNMMIIELVQVKG